MPELARFGMSLEKRLLAKFDRHIGKKNYRNRSEAIRDLIREELVKEEWVKGKEVAGAIVLVYDHHKRELVNKLTNLQHNFHKLIISNQHIHMDHNNCLEMVVIKGKPEEIKSLANEIKSTKGVKYSTLAAATTAKELI